jgi:phage gpG-like protein
MTKKLGIIQSRGLGDIVIALPIARHYRKEGWDIHWPICKEFLPHVRHHVPWVNWYAVQTDPGSFFYDQPMKLLQKQGCDEILPLYQALTGHNFHEELYFQQTKFDQYKYIRAGVPFLNKWRLSECITRDHRAEQALYDKLVTNPKYAVIHLEGSDHRAQFDYSTIPKDWQTIEITADATSSIFNWLKILESAESIVCVDSVFANLVDQMQLTNDKYFIARSHIGLTPVQGMDWNWVKFT